MYIPTKPFPSYTWKYVKLYGADVEEARAKKISAEQIKNAQEKMVEIMNRLRAEGEI